MIRCLRKNLYVMHEIFVVTVEETKKDDAAR